MTTTTPEQAIREQAARAMAPLYAPGYPENEIQRILPYLMQLVDATGLLATIDSLRASEAQNEAALSEEMGDHADTMKRLIALDEQFKALRASEAALREERDAARATMSSYNARCEIISLREAIERLVADRDAARDKALEDAAAIATPRVAAAIRAMRGTAG